MFAKIIDLKSISIDLLLLSFKNIGIHENDMVELIQTDDSIVIKKANEVIDTPRHTYSNTTQYKYVPKTNIKERLITYGHNYVKDEELDWGDPVGEEVW